MPKHKKHGHHHHMRIQFLLEQIPHRKIGVATAQERKSVAERNISKGRLFPESTHPSKNRESHTVTQSRLLPEQLLESFTKSFTESATQSYTSAPSRLFPEEVSESFSESATQSYTPTPSRLFPEEVSESFSESATQSYTPTPSRLFPEENSSIMVVKPLTSEVPESSSINGVTENNTATKLSTKNKILLTTSIAPVQIEKQRQAIDTWIKAGFDVVSLNTSEEVALLKPYFPDVQFETMTRSAISQYGKPYIYIYDFMQYLIKQDYNVYGIINSDIHFLDIKSDFIKFIYNHALDSLVYGHRVDVNNINEKNGTVSNGVDYFFFNKKIAAVYEDEGMCMGQPAWDWWMVCVPATKGFNTKRILSKNAYHIIHPQAWDQSLNQYLIETIVLNKHMKSVYPSLSQLDLNTKMWEIVITDKGIRYNSY